MEHIKMKQNNLNNKPLDTQEDDLSDWDVTLMDGLENEPYESHNTYLEDNMDMIFGTECIFDSLSKDLRKKLENNE